MEEQTTEQVAEAPESGLAPQEERTMAMLCHLSSLAGLIIPVPFANILAPLIFWLMNKDKMPFVDEQGKESLNFQITIAIAMLISAILIVVVIGFLLVFVVLIAWIVLTIIATIKVNSGEHYRYPFALRLIK